MFAPNSVCHIYSNFVDPLDLASHHSFVEIGLSGSIVLIPDDKENPQYTKSCFNGELENTIQSSAFSLHLDRRQLQVLFIKM